MKSSKSSANVALFVILNLFSFAIVSSCYTCGQGKPQPKPNIPIINNPNPNYPSPSTGGSSSPSNGGHCPRDALKLGICAKVLNGPVNAVVGTPPTLPCCSVIEGLLDLEVAVCFCTAIKANILGINLNIPIVLNLLLGSCGKQLPSEFLCA